MSATNNTQGKILILIKNIYFAQNFNIRVIVNYQAYCLLKQLFQIII